jgi:hypothetical protein
MSESSEESKIDKLQTEVHILQLSFNSLQTEFKLFRNIMVALYLTIIAPLMVAVLGGMLNGKH